MGAATDEPEGARVIQLTDTLAMQWSKLLRQAADVAELHGSLHWELPDELESMESLPFVVWPDGMACYHCGQERYVAGEYPCHCCGRPRSYDPIDEPANAKAS